MISPPFTVALLLADARLPVGSHVQSGGLEPALLAGLSPAAVPEYLRARVATVARVEAGAAVVARSVSFSASSSPAAVLAALLAVENSWAARTPSAALRAVSRALGRGLLRLAARLWPQHPAIVACGRHGVFARPVVLGALAAAAGLNAEELARLVFYEDAQSVASAMLKLEPLDPIVCVEWVLAACAEAEQYVSKLAALTSADAIPAAGAPQIEEWAEAHSRRTRRLFLA